MQGCWLISECCAPTVIGYVSGTNHPLLITPLMRIWHVRIVCSSPPGVSAYGIPTARCLNPAFNTLRNYFVQQHQPRALSSRQQIGRTASHAGHHSLELPHFLHHLLHLVELIEHRVDLSHSDTAAFGYPLTAFRVQDLRVQSFLRSHTANDSFHVLEFFLVFLQIGPFQCFRSPGQHADDRLEWTKLFHLAQLVEKILERELAFAHFFFEPLGIIQIDRLGGFFNQAYYITHSQ